MSRKRAQPATPYAAYRSPVGNILKLAENNKYLLGWCDIHLVIVPLRALSSQKRISAASDNRCSRTQRSRCMQTASVVLARLSGQHGADPSVPERVVKACRQVNVR